MDESDLHPHELYEIRLDGLTSRFPRREHGPGTSTGCRPLPPQRFRLRLSSPMAPHSISSQAPRKSPLRFRFPTLQVHNLHQGQPLALFCACADPEAAGNRGRQTVRLDHSGPMTMVKPLSARIPCSMQIQQAEGTAGHPAASGFLTRGPSPTSRLRATCPC
jgi:hypothetical protein